MMAEIRCPMCGMENPSELEVCQFCQARLKPLVGQPPSGNGGDTFSEDDSFLKGENRTDSDFPEWLKNLRTEETEKQDRLYDDLENEEQPIQAEKPPAQQEGRPDWLSSLRDDADFGSGSLDLDESGEPAESFDSFGLEDEPHSDWLDRIRLRKEEDKREAFLDSFEETQDEAESGNLITSIESEEPQAAKDDLPFDDETSVPTLDIDEVFDGQAVPPFVDKEFLAEPTTPDPEWLRALKEETNSGEEETFTLGLDEIPAKPQEEIQESPEAVPDWLAHVTEEPRESPSDEPEVVPDWLAHEVGSTESIEPESEDMPDWLSELIPEETPSSSSAEEQPIDILAKPESYETPDWLADLGGSSEAKPAVDEIKEDWSKGATPLPIIEDAEPNLSGREGIVDWVDQEAEGEKYPDEGAESDLEPAELPSWLAAMRPLGSSVPSIGDVESDVVESAGPLVGLSGVLSADSNMARPQNGSAYAVKLQVSKEQRAHVELLKDMVDGEGKAHPVPKQPVISSHKILRWVISLVLFLAILWPAFTADQQVPMPTYSQETGDVNGLINDLPEDARILVAFDYQPGLAAEMDTTAAAVIDHIMLRGAYLTLVSTSPTGPLVAERFLSQTQANHNYNRGEQYINLGYIPGGATGLLSFAVSPQRTVPYTTDEVEAWQTSSHNALPALRGIERLIDFSMILVIVDDPDIARSWIEQVQPYLTSEDGGTPLVMAVSAQSEPLVRPYYEASPRQLQGFVAGMRGGASYARLTGRIGLANRYWDGFSAGLTVAAILIAIGGVVNVATVFISRRDQSKGKTQP